MSFSFFFVFPFPFIFCREIFVLCVNIYICECTDGESTADIFLYYKFRSICFDGVILVISRGFYLFIYPLKEIYVKQVSD